MTTESLQATSGSDNLNINSTQIATDGNVAASELNNLPRSSKAKADPDTELKVNVSASLLKKLKFKASEEGIAVDDFAAELLAEGLVLRAWEIMERKTRLQGFNGGAPGPNSGNNRNSFNGRGGPQNGGGKGRRGMSSSQYQNLMEDKAAFLEYVRNQEKTRR